jgi:hypothetical protein
VPVPVPVPVPEKSGNLKANGIIEALPRGRSRLADQFTH